jgi:hypothetical protein
MSFINKFIRSIWLFPAILAVFLVGLSAAGINGSSIGVYDVLLQDNPHSLIKGTPRTIRSDEWVVNTPLTFSQVNNNFPVINHDIGNGQDMTVVSDVPYKEWSILFKPQNLIFFILPLVQAFAFKWWFLSFILMVSVYLFFVRITSKKLIASLLAVFIAFNPFIQWWYQSITILPIAYTFLMLTLAIQLFRTNSRKLRVIYSCLLSYFMVCFALIMYPPFQIPCALAGLFIFAAWYFAKYPWRHVFTSKLYLYLGASLAGSGLLVAGFILQHQEAVKLILHTSYPGHRVIASGGQNINSLLNWPFSYLLKNDQTPLIFGTNASGASSFLLFGIICLPYLIYSLFIKRTKTKNTQFLRISRYLLAVSTLLLAILSVRMFVPAGSFAFKLIGLGAVPHQRLLIAFGIINLVLMALAVCSLGFPKRRILITKCWAIFAVFTFLVFLATLKHAHSVFHLASVGRKEFAAIVLLCTIIVALLVHPWHKLRIAGLGLAVMFALVCSAQINPLYRGTGSLLNGNLSTEVSRLEKQDNQRWLVNDYFPIENLPLAVGAEAIGGTQTYPQLDLWKTYFPNESTIYNRYAHINFIIDDKTTTSNIALRQEDFFSIKTSSCSQMLRDFNVGYIISTKKTDTLGCFSPLDSSPSGSPFVIYKRDH